MRPTTRPATILGLGYPGGPKVDAAAQHPLADPFAEDLPVSRLEPGSLDFSFSGLKTALLYAVRGMPTRRGPGGVPKPQPTPPPLTEQRVRDLAASFQRAACHAVMLKIGRALDMLGERGIVCRSILAGGGVTANSRLRKELTALADERGLVLSLPAMGYCLDNAAMIAALGARLYQEGHRDDLSLRAHPSSDLGSFLGSCTP
ncbi:MAG: hypothetical protein KatS3mg103_0044 [Phycisphaerales bacterium]|nr:MAG: hypothetical protein KatS3mg103_0044 [Phycisphaerales bacterium]